MAYGSTHHRPIHLCLCVDDFWFKYFNEADVEHLQQTIGTILKYSSDWTRTNFCGMQFDWQYDERYIDISMLEYASKDLQWLQHTPIKPQYSPHHHKPIYYGKKGVQQLPSEIDTLPQLRKTPHDVVFCIRTKLHH